MHTGFVAPRSRTTGDTQKVTKFCQILSDKAETVSLVDFKRILDHLLIELQRVDQPDQRTTHFNRILTALFSVPPNILLTLIEYALFAHMRTHFIAVLKRWNQTFQLTGAESFYFWNCNKLLHIFVETTASVDFLLNGIADVALLNQIAETLTNLSTSTKVSESYGLKLFASLLHIIAKCQRRATKEKSNKVDAFAVLLEPAVQCLTSTHVFDSFLSLSKEKRKMNSKDEFYLIRLPDFLICYQGSKRESILRQYLSKVLSQFENLLGQVLVSINQWPRPVIRAVYQTSRLFHHACIDSSTNCELMSEHLVLIDHFLKIIYSLTAHVKIEERKLNTKGKLLDAAIDLLVVLIHRPAIVERIQAHKMSETFLRLQGAVHANLSQNSTTLLATTAREDDMKNIKNPSELLSNVVSSLKMSLDSKPSEASSHPPSEQTLETLKSLVQHDQMKEEVLKQNSIPFMLQCVNKVTNRSLMLLFEALWTLSFSADAAKVLRQDEAFLTRIQGMSEKTFDEGLQKAIEGLVWKLIKEPAMLERASSQDQQMKTITTSEVIIDENGQPKTVTKVVEHPAERVFDYDIMISYCHADKELVYKIHKFLLDQGFKIWIDLNHMHGPAMSAMADAVDNSEFVLLCMSESYKKSTYCQAEAEYAFGRKRRLVPLIVRPNYCADGWLGFLIGSRIYIDYGTFDFPTACDKLIHEIQLQRQRPLPSQAAAGNHQVPSKKEPEPAPQPEPTKAKELPDEYKKRKPKSHFQRRPIFRWTESDVLDFLAARQLFELMPLCDKMAGNALVQLYKMCAAKQHRIYAILHDELKERHQVKLSISTYTRFLTDMEILLQPRAAPEPAPPPVVIAQPGPTSTAPYDILVTSNAPPNQMLAMVQRMLPQLPTSTQTAYYR